MAADSFERANKVDIARAVRAGELSAAEAGAMLLARADRHMLKLERKEAARGERPIAGSSAPRAGASDDSSDDPSQE